MIITKNNDHVLLKNDKGEYHLSLEEYISLGHDAAIKKAEEEIELKLKSSYKNKTINFNQARELGFCEYGITDFCKRLGLNVNESYEIEYLNKRLTLEALKEYPDECIKLFGKNTLKHFGGVLGVLSEDTIDLVLRHEFIPEKTLHLLAVDFAYSCLDIYEKEYPDDDRPRKAIEAKEAWIRGDINNEKLSAARSAARSAEWSAKWSAECSAECSAERKNQVEMIKKKLKQINEWAE